MSVSELFGSVVPEQPRFDSQPGCRNLFSNLKYVHIVDFASTSDNWVNASTLWLSG